MHLILTGATGLVGSALSHHIINTPAITKVSVLSRRPVAQAEGHEKVKVIIHKDYANYPSKMLAQLNDAEGVVWVQGISSTQVGKEEYESIAHTYPIAFARAISTTTSPKPINFVYVSGEGATTKPGQGFMKALEGALIPALRAALPSMMSPTRDLARVLTDLAMSDRKAFEETEKGVSGEGRTLNNVAMRRLAGL